MFSFFPTDSQRSRWNWWIRT